MNEIKKGDIIRHSLGGIAVVIQIYKRDHLFMVVVSNGGFNACIPREKIIETIRPFNNETILEHFLNPDKFLYSERHKCSALTSYKKELERAGINYNKAAIEAILDKMDKDCKILKQIYDDIIKKKGDLNGAEKEHTG